jgi:hypothetical protein
LARINFETSVYSNPNYATLLLKVGCQYKTKGMLLTAWELAQKYWLEHKAIPVDKWPDDLNILIELKFASSEARDSGMFIYVSGSKEHCSFIEKQSKAGKIGGLSRSTKKLKTLRQYAENTEALPKPDRNLINPTEVSYSYSYSNSKEKKNISAVALPRLAVLWNIHSKKFPKVKACGAQRKKQAEARWRENPSEEYWVDVITRLNASEFCNGKNERGWVADFDFLIKPETANKTLEGKYSTVGKVEELSYMAKKIKGIT